MSSRYSVIILDKDVLTRIYAAAKTEGLEFLLRQADRIFVPFELKLELDLSPTHPVARIGDGHHFQTVRLAVPGQRTRGGWHQVARGSPGLARLAPRGSLSDFARWRSRVGKVQFALTPTYGRRPHPPPRYPGSGSSPTVPARDPAFAPRGRRAAASGRSGGGCGRPGDMT
jgi:hypothetical protein